MTPVETKNTKSSGIEIEIQLDTDDARAKLDNLAVHVTAVNELLDRTLNMDCMQGMAQFPDGYFDLAVVDPPYGGAGNTFKCSDKTRFGGRFDRYRSTAPAVQNLAGGV